MQASSKYCLVLGRLFKIHPTFDEIVYRILLDTSVGVGGSNAANYYIVFFSEAQSKWNAVIYERLLSLFSVQRHPEFINRVKFVHFHHYTDLIISATVILDTFPYGGMWCVNN